MRREAALRGGDRRVREHRRRRHSSRASAKALSLSPSLFTNQTGTPWAARPSRSCWRRPRGGARAGRRARPPPNRRFPARTAGTPWLVVVLLSQRARSRWYSLVLGVGNKLGSASAAFARAVKRRASLLRWAGPCDFLLFFLCARVKSLVWGHKCGQVWFAVCVCLVTEVERHFCGALRERRFVLGRESLPARASAGALAQRSAPVAAR